MITWGIVLFVFIYEQRIDLEYIQQDRPIVFTNDAYVFSSVGENVDDTKKYRLDYGKGKVLYGFSQPESFVSQLKFNFTGSRQIRFASDFHLTQSCQTGTIPNDSKLHIIVNNESEYLLSNAGGQHSEVTIELTSNDQVSVRADASQGACGALLVKMNEIEKGGWQHYLLINGIWLLYIVLMLSCGRLFLPLLSFGIFYVFQKAELIYSSVLSWEQLFIFSSTAILVGLLISLIVSLRKNRLVRGAVVGTLSLGIVLLACLLPMIVLGFDEMFQVQMNKYDWFAIMQTDLAESIEFVKVFAPVSLLVKLGSLVFLFLLLLYFSGRKSIQYKFVHWLGILFFALVLVFVDSKSRLISKSFAAINEYNDDLALLEEKAQQRAKNAEKIAASKDGTDEVYVVIIGESANRNHFSLYGYPRFTNPELEKRLEESGLVVYDQAYSCGVSTLGTLQYALTAATLKKGAPRASATIMDVLNHVGFETSWIHNGSTSLRNNLLGVISEQAKYTDHLSSIYGTEDGKLLAEVEKMLAKDTGKNKAIFLKTQGSHIAYCERLPDDEKWTFADKDFDRWLIPDKYELTKVSAQSNCFDGSIKYTDFFIEEIIDMVEDTGKTAAVIYISDHGDEVVRGTAHMGKSPTYGVFAVPMILWFSDNYQQKYNEKYANIVTNAANVFINDVLFDSLLGLMAVDYDKLVTKNDISSTSFIDGKWIYRGKKTVYDSDNNIYHTPRNIDKIRKSDRPYPIYLGPLEHPFHMSVLTGADRYGLVSLAAMYKDGTFYLDSPLYNTSPIAIDTVLTNIPYIPEKKIFFQIKVDETGGNTTDAIVNQLFELFKTYKINQTDLIVSSNDSKLLMMLKNKGVEVSYLLDNKEITSVEDGHEVISIDLEQLLSEQGNLDGLTFDVKIGSCDINSCDQKLFKQIDDLAGRVTIRNVILPLYEM